MCILVGSPKMLCRCCAKCSAILGSSSTSKSRCLNMVWFVFGLIGLSKLFSTFQCLELEHLKSSRVLKFECRLFDFIVEIAAFIFLSSML